MAAAVLLAACSRSKSVQWIEEVQLNTQETLLVSRIDTFKQGSEPGNPLQSAWWLQERAYNFSWKGQSYSYKVPTGQSEGILLIHVIPSDGAVAIVDFNSRCAKPGYAEFRLIDGQWKSQRNVAPELIGQPRNIIAYQSAEEGRIPSRVTRSFAERYLRNSPRIRPHAMELTDSNAARDC
jgi:hypothetical protein